MAVVVSDTTPLHYLILVGQESILQKLYGKVGGFPLRHATY